MNNDNQETPSRRAPRKRGKARSQRRGTDAAQRDSAQAASAPKIHGPHPKHTERGHSEQEHPSAAHTLAVIPLDVRWRDLDAFNHVNNSSYLTFLEEARLQWLRMVPGEWFTEHAMPVMAAIELHYRKPIAWPSEVDVLLSCERLGNTSITIGNRIVDRNGADCLYADGNIVMVWIDPASGAAVPLPDAIRAECTEKGDGGK